MINTKLIAIGNSQGVRLPQKLINKYHLDGTLLLEELADGLLIRPADADKLSWNETYKEMATSREDWSDFDVSITDGLEEWK